MISATDKIDNNYKQIEKIVKDELIGNVKELIFEGHRKIVQDHNNKLEEKKIEKELQEKVNIFYYVKKQIEDEKQRKIDKENEREKRRNDRIRSIFIHLYIFRKN